MRKFISFLMICMLIFSLVMITPVSAKTDIVIGTTPNGTPVTEKQATTIQDKLDNALAQAHIEEIDIRNNDAKIDKNDIFAELDSASYLSSQDKLKIFQSLDNGKEILSFSATTYFVEENEYGIMVPLSEDKLIMKPMDNGEISVQSSNNYDPLTVIAMVLNNGSTSSKRKYEMFGGVQWKKTQNDTTKRDNALALRWAGGEAITKSYSNTEYKLGSYVKTSTNNLIDSINNGGVIYTMYGRYPDTTPLPPSWAGVTALTEQTGAPTKVYNATCTYTYTWLTLGYSFGFSSSGLSITVKPQTGSTPYICTTTYGKGQSPFQ